MLFPAGIISRNRGVTILDNPAGMAGLFVAGVVAGAINSVAGGGTLVSFPSLIAYGIPSILANATNTAAVCPGSVSSGFAYRKDLPEDKSLLWELLLPSFFGGLLGAVVLAVTPEKIFARIVPFLVLFATVIFGGRDYLARLFKIDNSQGTMIGKSGRIWGFCFQLFVAAYGGYFGAGIGILMLASLGLMGLSDIHRMNALKTFLASVINGVALVYFILKGLVVWPIAILMAAGAVLGGYWGARLAKRIPQHFLRLFIISVGLAVSLWLFARK
jgi:uncharacterized protein